MEKSLSKKQVANEMGISVKTLMKWINDKNMFPDKSKNKQLFTPKEVDFIKKEFVM